MLLHQLPAVNKTHHLMQEGLLTFSQGHRKPVSPAYKHPCHPCAYRVCSTLPCSKRKEPSNAVPKTTEELEVEKVMSLHAPSCSQSLLS